VEKTWRGSWGVSGIDTKRKGDKVVQKGGGLHGANGYYTLQIRRQQKIALMKNRGKQGKRDLKG